MALLLSVYLGEGPHTVRGLAKDLKISKPAVSRALDRLGELNYIRRERDDLDRRNVLVQRTTTGAKYLIDFAAVVMDATTNVAAIPETQVLPFTQDTMTAPAVNAIPPSLQSNETVEQNWTTDIAA